MLRAVEGVAELRAGAQQLHDRAAAAAVAHAHAPPARENSAVRALFAPVQ